MGRTEQFTEVRFALPQSVGQIVPTTITGHDGQRLVV